MISEEVIDMQRHQAIGQYPNYCLPNMEISESVDTEATVQLCHKLVRQSRYKEAFAEAKKLEKILNCGDIAFWRTLLSAFLLSATTILKNRSLKKIIYFSVKRLSSYNDRRCNVYSINEGLLWGIYWQDMRKALRMNVFCVLTAESPVEKTKSRAFLHYTLAFMGYSGLGLLGLRRLITKCEEDDRKDVIRDLLTWLGVAYQMGGYAQECIDTHQRLAAEFPEAEPFYQIISFASQLNMSISELGPEEVRTAVDRCFSISFALQESRNYIQVFGGKAALLGIEGRWEEAISFLDRARAAKKRNHNTLDDLIFHRLAAITYLNLGSPKTALCHINLARKKMRKYAFVMWYRQEIARLSAIAEFQLSKNKFFLANKFLSQVIYLPNFNLFKKSLRLYYRFLVQKEMSYWSFSSEALYFKNLAKKTDLAEEHSTLEKVTLLLTRVILNSDFIKTNSELGPVELRLQVEQVFPNSKVIISESLNSGLNEVRDTYGLSNGFVYNEQSDCLRASCPNDMYYIAVRASSAEEVSRPLAVGIVISKLNINSHEIVESALRILLTLYLSRQLSCKIHEERSLNQKRNAISSIATQVAHDIRSPLTALEVAMHKMTELATDERKLLAFACSRIRGIADDLLTQARGMHEKKVISTQRPDLTKFSVTKSVAEIIVEKKAMFPDLQFNLDSQADLHIVGEQIQFQRIVSNLMNNSIEAISLKDKGVVDICIRSHNGKVSVYIKDNGKGIPQEIVSRIGEVGFTHGKSSGNGLGISFAKSKMKEWGGDFNLISRENEGTIITLSMVGA
jgi:signal transduction histidine kinase